MKFEHTEVFNFEGALRGMRNPLERCMVKFRMESW